MRKNHLFILVGSHSYEFRFLENITPERGVWELEDVVGPDEMKPRLVFVHGIQYRL